jgi:hypothetical protein
VLIATTQLNTKLGWIYKHAVQLGLCHCHTNQPVHAPYHLIPPHTTAYLPVPPHTTPYNPLTHLPHPIQFPSSVLLMPHSSSLLHPNPLLSSLGLRPNPFCSHSFIHRTYFPCHAHLLSSLRLKPHPFLKTRVS